MTVDVLVRNNVNILGRAGKPSCLHMASAVIRICGGTLCLLFFEQYRIVLFDYAGSGQSQINYYDALKYNNLNGYAQDVLEIMEALELRDVIFVGHSVSSMIGMLASIRRRIFSKISSCLGLLRVI